MKFRQTRPLAYHINMQASTFPEAKSRVIANFVIVTDFALLPDEIELSARLISLERCQNLESCQSQKCV